MKKIIKLFSIILFLISISICLVACSNNEDKKDDNTTVDDGNKENENQDGDKDNTDGGNTDIDIEPDEDGKVDYASSVKLNLQSSETLKYEVTVKCYIDGDTTHFYLPSGNTLGSDFVKARYLAVNTPESTGKIEAYGKKASKYTKEKLMSATSIYIESDDANWNADSTGSRYLLWIWYKTKDDTDYRNLNIELLQEGLAIASNSANNRYGSIAMAAIAQAKNLKLNVYSGEKDPDMYYGTAVEATLKEIRLNIESYNGIKVAFEGVVTKDYSQTVYVEDYDEELQMYFGMQVYYGFGASGPILNALSVGNRVRVVGTVQYYENGGTYQVAGLQYDMMDPNNAENTQVIEEGHKAAYTLTDIDTFLSDVDVEVYQIDEGTEEETLITKTYKYAELAMSSSIQMKDLEVVSVYTTSNEDSSSKGAMTLTCKSGGKTITVRTVVLYTDSTKTTLVTEDAYKGKTITVKGIVDYYNGSYQIKVYSAKQITVNE